MKTKYQEIRKNTEQLWSTLCVEAASPANLATTILKAEPNDFIRRYALDGLGENPMQLFQALKLHARFVNAGWAK